MQKLIAKYGTAAHLALLAVAPLFLFPFFEEATTAIVLLWLCLPAFSWVILEPSLRGGEALHNARRRVLWAILSDPLFWVSLFLVLLTGVRALNSGIGLVYDAELTKWNVSPAVMPILPGCVEGTGFLPFAAMVAATILMQGCRHSLGRQARMAFLLVSSALAGLAGVIAIYFGDEFGLAAIKAAIECSPTACFYVGVAFYLHLMGGTVALFGAFEHRWNLTMPLFIFSIGGTIAAGFLFAPPLVTVIFLSAEIILLAYVFICATKVLAAAGEFKLLVVSGLAFTLGGLLLMALEQDVVESRIAVFMAQDFLPESFRALRKALSGVALRAWLSHLWIGTGLGSFSLAFRFHASPEDWALLRAGAQSMPNGWWFLLAERGVVGALFVALPVGFLVFTWIRRLVGWIGSWSIPSPCCLLGPLVLIALVVTGMFGCALFRADVTIITVALLAVSANSFPPGKRK